VTVGDTIDFRLGDNSSHAYDGTGLAVTITPPPPTPSLPAIATDQNSKIGPATFGDVIHFTCTTQAGLDVRVQSTTDPSFAEGTWTDLPGGGAMIESPAGTYTLDAAS